MAEHTVEQFLELKKSFDTLQKKSKKTKADLKNIKSLTQKLNKCAESLIEKVSFTGAFNWLCDQNECRRKNCSYCNKEEIETLKQNYMEKQKKHGISFKNLKLHDDSDGDVSSEPAVQTKIPTKKQIEKALERLDALIGMPDIKNQVRAFIKDNIVNRKRKKLGLPEHKPGMHMIFTGNPGTGKTEVARLVAQIFKDLHILKKGHLTEVDRGGLVGEYVGWTEWKVKELIEEAKDGVLFIDEAYALADSYRGGFGDEAINALVKAMEDNREHLVIIAAGYTEEMQWFLKSNPGLQSRFPHHLEFADYTPEDLAHITEKFAGDKDVTFTEAARSKLRRGLEQMPPEMKDKFGNARGCRNLFEKALKNQSERIFDKNLRAMRHFTTLLPEDIDFGYQVQDKNVRYLSG